MSTIAELYPFSDFNLLQMTLFPNNFLTVSVFYAVYLHISHFTVVFNSLYMFGNIDDVIDAA